MYARITKFKVKSGREDEAKATATRVLKSFEGVKGFVGTVICSDKETNEWSKIVVWETKEDHVTHAKSISPERQEEDMGLIDPIEAKDYDVVGYATAD